MPAQALDDAAERRRIAVEREQVQSRYRAESGDCAARFAVTACEDTARARRRADLERLQAQQASLDDARRRQRATQRQARIERQLQHDTQRPQAPVAGASGAARAVVRNRVRQVDGAASAAAPSRAATPRSTARLPVDSHQEAKRSQEAAQRREREAAAHRREVEARNADLSRRKPAAAPLPPSGQP